MHLSILGDREGWHARDLERAARSRGHEALHLDFQLLGHGLACDWEKPQTDGLIVRTMPAGSLEQVVFRMDLLAAWERLGIRVVNRPKALEAAIDKFLSLELLHREGLPVPPTIGCQDLTSAMLAFDRLGRDVVVKPLFGSEGRGMVRIQDEQIAWRVCHSISRTGSVIYLQKFVENPGWDLRLFVLGHRVLGGMKRLAVNGDWRTNVAQGGKAEFYPPQREECGLAVRAARAVGAELAGIDLLRAQSGDWYVLEVNAVPGWRAFSKVTEIDVALEIVKYLETGRKEN
ncbi:MAG: RimK family alpha-L-glutamate ligase [Gemmataceae bacterium]|nr:RimK family alpha-L-glutamate ligase [Gemmataceae bacterium]